MFYKITTFPFLENFIDNSEVILNELLDCPQKFPFVNRWKFFNGSQGIHEIFDLWVKEGGFHSKDIGYDLRENSAAYASLPIYKKYHIPYNNAMKNIFPKTYRLLQEVPCINFASFLQLQSCSHIKSHSHILENLIFHVTLWDVGEGCSITCNGETRPMSFRGDYVIFDYSYEHSSINNSFKNRLNLAIDFTPAEKHLTT